MSPAPYTPRPCTLVVGLNCWHFSVLFLLSLLPRVGFETPVGLSICLRVSQPFTRPARKMFFSLFSREVWLPFFFCECRHSLASFSLLLLRFCLCETSCPQEDYFPPNLFVKVNGKLCPLPVSKSYFFLICCRRKPALLDSCSSQGARWECIFWR